MFVLLPADRRSVDVPGKGLSEDLGQLGYRKQDVHRVTVDEYDASIGVDRSQRI
jgi:hypothetical protein